MADKRNPYVNKMTLEDIAHAEASYFYLQIGDETAEFQGKQTFSKEKAEYLFWELMTSLRQMVKDGSNEEKKIARYGLIYFRMHQLRIH